MGTNTVFNKKFDSPLTLEGVGVGCGEIAAFQGIGHIRSYHKQDCCENVYADWNYLEPFIAQVNFPVQVSEMSIIGVKGEGFVLKYTTTDISPIDGEPEEVKFFVPCYNSQNGYYSSDLDLIIEVRGEKTKVNISDYLKDEIY